MCMLGRLGMPRAVSKGGTVLWRWDGEAFGDSLPNETVAGSLHKLVMPLRFPGQYYYDAESGLHYNYFRDYSPGAGRYVESDPIGLKGGLNTYSYVGSPIGYVDPYGLARDTVSVYCEQHGPKACAEAGAMPDSAAMRAAKKGLKQREKKQISDICKDAKIKDREDFGEFLEREYKPDNGYRGGDTMSYDELREAARQYKGLR